MSLTRNQKVRKRDKDRISLLREELAALSEHTAAVTESNNSLEREKEQLVVLNNQLIDRVKYEQEQQRPFAQAFMVCC